MRHLLTQQELTPVSVAADYTFDVIAGTLSTPSASGIRELTCECDPSLRPYEVTIDNLEKWELRGPNGTTDLKPVIPPPSGYPPGVPNTLVIHLREPFQSGELSIRCLAPLVSGKEWTSPAIRLSNAGVKSSDQTQAQGGETLLLHLHPDVHLESWQAGSFHLDRATTEPDGSQLLSLSSTASVAGTVVAAVPARPRVRVVTQEAEFRARQLTLWQPAPPTGVVVAPEKGSGTFSAAGKVPDPFSALVPQHLTTQIRYELLRGQLFQLALQLPPDWEVDQVELSPAELRHYWSVRQEGGRSILVVDLQRPSLCTKGYGSAYRSHELHQAGDRANRAGRRGRVGLVLPVSGCGSLAGAISRGRLGD